MGDWLNVECDLGEQAGMTPGWNSGLDNKEDSDTIYQGRETVGRKDSRHGSNLSFRSRRCYCL